MSKPNLRTLSETLRNSVNLYGNKPAFKVKKEGKFHPITYQEFYDLVKKFGTGLLKIGIKEFDHIGLISDNRFEWIIADMAIIGLRAVDVPCSGDSSINDIHFKLNHSDANAVILEGDKQLIKFFSLADRLIKIKNIILFDQVTIFSDQEDAPQWSIPVNYKEDNKISKRFKTELKSLLKNNEKYLLLSSKAREYLDKYLEKEGRQILEELSSSLQEDALKEKLLQKIFVVDQNFNEINSYKIFSFQQILQFGEESLTQGNNQFEEISKNCQPDDLVTIIYTSGTTAEPKGVMLTNANFMHNVINAPKIITINQNDNFLSILPSWHVYERAVEYCALYMGASTAYSKPFKQVLLPDLASERPTVMCSVPRVWESVYKGIVDKINKESALQKTIFNWAIRIGEEYKEAEGILNGKWPLFDRPEYSTQELAQARRKVKSLGWKYRIADKLVFKKIRELTGGRLRFAISGGGALNESLDKFFNAIGLVITEGYGLTETSPILAGRTAEYNIMFTVGIPLPEVEIKIVDKDNLEKELPNGEVGIVLTKGPMVMKGYYKNEEKTKEVIRDGWFNTGDLGKKTYNGKFLKIVGRIKDTIVLRGGENVEPLPLEDKLKESKYINMVIIVGQDKPRLGALIVPDFSELGEFAKKESIVFQNNQELIEHPKIISLYQNEVKKLISKENGFKSYETVIGIALLPREFTIEEDELTETLKLKRFEIHKKYKEIIDRVCG